MISSHLIGHLFFSPSTLQSLDNIRVIHQKKFNEGQSLIDPELTSTKDLPSESDSLVTTKVSKKQYTYVKPIAERVDQYRSKQDNIMLAVKRFPHPLEDFMQQRQNFREIR